MVPEAVVDALQDNGRYAKAIVQLAGLKTSTVDGQVIEVAAQWDAQSFQPPIFLSIPNEAGRISWVHPDPAPRIYQRTLGMLEETFRQMNIPARMVVISVTLSRETKKPHFRAFMFRKEAFPVKDYDEIWLRRKAWKAEELETAVRELRKLKRKLKGVGY